MSDPVKAFEAALRAAHLPPGVGSDRSQLQLDFPWNEGDTAERALEQQWQLMEGYRLKVRKLAHDDPSLDAHYRLVDQAQSALLSVKVLLKRANNALYR